MKEYFQNGVVHQCGTANILREKRLDILGGHRLHKVTDQQI